MEWSYTSFELIDQRIGTLPRDNTVQQKLNTKSISAVVFLLTVPVFVCFPRQRAYPLIDEFETRRGYFHIVLGEFVVT